MVWNLYSKWVKIAPVPTKMLLTAVLMSGADMVSQAIRMRAKPNPQGQSLYARWDKRRTANFFIFGTAAGFYFHYRFNFLDWVVPGYKDRHTILKIVIDQATFAPLYYSGFFFGIGVLEGQSVSDAINITKQKLWPTMMANFWVWPPAKYVNFKWVPLRHQVLFINSVSFCFAIYLAHKQTQAAQEAALLEKSASTTTTSPDGVAATTGDTNLIAAAAAAAAPAAPPSASDTSKDTDQRNRVPNDEKKSN